MMLRLLLHCLSLFSVICDHARSEGWDDEELLRETIEAGRGHRDTVGQRDQWSSTEHLGQASKINVRQGQPVSAKVRELLSTYRLECEGCDHIQAVAKINAFVLEAKRKHAQQQSQNWLERVAGMVTAVVMVAAAILFYHSHINGSINSKVSTIGGSGGDSRRRLEIEEQRRRVAEKEKQAQKKALANREPPSWRENEEKEVWTPKQEDQFARALVSFGGVPAKARYLLIADKVEGKNRPECLMHHKLLQLKAKEQ